MSILTKRMRSGTSTTNLEVLIGVPQGESRAIRGQGDEGPLHPISVVVDPRKSRLWLYMLKACVGLAVG